MSVFSFNIFEFCSNSKNKKGASRRIQVQEAKRYREPITPPGFLEAARSRNLELIRQRYIIHDTTGRAGRLTSFLHNRACADLFSKVSGWQPSGRLFFARTSCLDTREIRLASPSLLPSHFISKIISSTNRCTLRGGRKSWTRNANI